MLKRMTLAEISRWGASRPITITLEDFCNLAEGYPKTDGETRRMVWRGRWYLITGVLMDRLHFSWRQPVIRVKARSSRA